MKDLQEKLKYYLGTGLKYELDGMTCEFHLLARSLQKYELENILGNKLGIPQTVEKPQIQIIAHLKD